ncbi:MAG: hypothetical protein V4551_07875 [Pseudomonadota bacterium]
MTRFDLVASGLTNSLSDSHEAYQVPPAITGHLTDVREMMGETV